MSDIILTERQILEQCIEDCFDGFKELTQELGDILSDGGIFVKPNLYNMTTKRYREKVDLAEFLQWGRRNPSRFIEEVFNVQLMDYQRYLIDSSWNKPFVVWAMSRNGGKSLLAALFIMAKMLLIPGFKAYILAGVGSQSIELFTKMEQFAMKNISSFTNLNDIFQSNVVKSQSNSNGWVHNPASYTVRTYGGSQVFTLNGAFDNNRSKFLKLMLIIKLNLKEEPIMSKQWTEEEISFLKDNYKSMTYRQLSEYLDRSKSAIDLKINRLGLKKEKYTYNHNYFECIDTADKAYWLGFIYADGGIFVNEKLNSCELSIKLQLRDIDHLKKFNQSINGNNQILTFDRHCNLNGKYYKGCQIRLYSEKIVHDLEKHGVCQNKSLIIEMPQITEDLISHFIRGVFDGDGCITKNNHSNGQSYVRCDFTSGSRFFLEQLRKKLYEYNINSYICNDHDNVLRLVVGGMKNCDAFLKFIYNNANIYLDRKYEKKKRLYDELRIEQRLLRQSERAGFINLSEKENGNPETGIRVEGCI